MPKFNIITIEVQLVERKVKYEVIADDKETAKIIVKEQDNDFITNTEVVESFDNEDGLQSLSILHVEEQGLNDDIHVMKDSQLVNRINKCLENVEPTYSC